MIVLLDNLRSMHNVGSIFRTSDALGVSKLCLCGTTPPPKDVLGYSRQKFTKVSLGAEEFVEWEYFSNTLETVKNLKKQGFTIVAVEQHSRSILYHEDVSKASLDKVVLVVGNEVEGISKEVLDISDVILEVPMKGEKESLNVSVTFGIVAFSLQYS